MIVFQCVCAKGQGQLIYTLLIDALKPTVQMTSLKRSDCLQLLFK